MALFSRRCLQRMVNENAGFLRPEQTEEHVRRLNKIRDDYLSTEWEIVLINAFTKIGTIQHGPKLGGKKFVDVLFTGGEFEFAADIATVSDQQLHKRNPVQPLWDELARRVRKKKITSGGFRIEVGAHPDCASKGRCVRHKVMLPPVSELPEEIFNSDFDIFLTQISKELEKRREFRIHNTTTDVLIRYEPGAQTWTGSHLSFTSANVLDNNPVFNAPKGKGQAVET